MFYAVCFKSVSCYFVWKLLSKVILNLNGNIPGNIKVEIKNIYLGRIHLCYLCMPFVALCAQGTFWSPHLSQVKINIKSLKVPTFSLKSSFRSLQPIGLRVYLLLDKVIQSPRSIDFILRASHISW